MSGICIEDIIKSSDKIGESWEEKSKEHIISFTESELTSFVQNIIDSVVTPKVNELESKIYELDKETVRPFIQDSSTRLFDLEEKNTKLESIIEKQNLVFKTLGHNPSDAVNISADGSNNINELRAKKIFPILCEYKQLAPGDIIRICKLGKRGHETAHRVMDMAEKLYPDDCRHDISQVSGSSKHWLVHKDHIGFRK